MNPKCIFCKIIAGEIPCELVARSDQWVAFKDIHPKARVHVLVLPTSHIPTLNDVKDLDQDLLGELLIACSSIARKQGIADSGYRVAVNVGKGGGQEVFHLHLHVMGD